jgi:hypothetical protein
LWCYLEELGIFPVLQAMGLTGGGEEKGYSWFDLLLLDIARTFYGIASYSKACEHQELSLALFSHLLALPCNDSFLNGLASVSEEQIRVLRRWLVKRGKELGILEGKRVAMDFHQIDRDVRIAELRNFGKGPSPKKKLCYNGFRPHIAWDLETGCLMVAEFRKSSARGTSTIQRFTNDYLMPDFHDLFECVYIDSEYTGKDVWEFIMEPNGMNAHLTACLKQNPFVKRARDAFLNGHAQRDDFWKYYDDEHVYADGTFPLVWPESTDTSEQSEHALTPFRLNCVVKKNLKTGSYRCFGSSRSIESPLALLDDYSSSSTVRFRISRPVKGLRRRNSGVAPCDYFHRGAVGSLDVGRDGYAHALHGRRGSIALRDSLDAGWDGHTHGPEYGSARPLQVAAQQKPLPLALDLGVLQGR